MMRWGGIWSWCVRVGILACCLFSGVAAGFPITSRYSPRNGERPRRPGTLYIILHTTEGASKGSFDKVWQRGEANYFVDRDGHVSRIIHRRRIAFHAGRSMWDGRTNIDNWSIGIEVVGYHNRALTEPQYESLRVIIAELQKIYDLPDDRVLCHAMVAYGAPNRWHKRSHRGRKRCGMLFAGQAVRKRLGLTTAPTYDPDVKAGRLVAADPFLAAVLYGGPQDQVVAAERYDAEATNVVSAQRSAWDIARDLYDNRETIYEFPDGTKKRGDAVKNWKRIPVGTKVMSAKDVREDAVERVKELGGDGERAADMAGAEYGAKTTIYFLTDGRVRRGDELSAAELASLPAGTKLLVGYVYGGYITARRSAFDACGPRWKLASTFYLFPDGSIHSGDSVNENAIPRKTLVFYRN